MGPAEGQNLAKAFVEELKPYDGGMAERLAGAAGGVLRYVGTIDVRAGTGKVELKAFPMDHAFAGTKHADNVVLFHTALGSHWPWSWYPCHCWGSLRRLA